MNLYRVRTRNGAREPEFELYALHGREAREKATILCRLSGVSLLSVKLVER